MEKRRRFRLRSLAFFIGLLSLMVLAGCQGSMNSAKHPDPPRDINEALRAHDSELMAIPGVVGVYVGLLKDRKSPCLKVMVARKTRQLERSVPASLEGYPVLVEETGIIRPMQQQ